MGIGSGNEAADGDKMKSEWESSGPIAGAAGCRSRAVMPVGLGW